MCVLFLHNILYGPPFKVTVLLLSEIFMYSFHPWCEVARCFLFLFPYASNVTFHLFTGDFCIGYLLLCPPSVALWYHQSSNNPVVYLFFVINLSIAECLTEPECNLTVLFSCKSRDFMWSPAPPLQWSSLGGSSVNKLWTIRKYSSHSAGCRSASMAALTSAPFVVFLACSWSFVLCEGKSCVFLHIDRYRQQK